MITATTNPDKTITLTLDAQTQAAFDAVALIRGSGFFQDWINSKFSELSVRVKHIQREGYIEKFNQADDIRKRQALDVLEGKGNP